MALLINRQFEILTFDCELITVGLEDVIIQPPTEKLGVRFEYIYALRDMAEELLQLKVGDVIHFNMNRDGDEKALLRRFK